MQPPGRFGRSHPWDLIRELSRTGEFCDSVYIISKKFEWCALLPQLMSTGQHVVAFNDPGAWFGDCFEFFFFLSPADGALGDNSIYSLDFGHDLGSPGYNVVTSTYFAKVYCHEG